MNAFDGMPPKSADVLRRLLEDIRALNNNDALILYNNIRKELSNNRHSIQSTSGIKFALRWVLFTITGSYMLFLHAILALVCMQYLWMFGGGGGIHRYYIYSTTFIAALSALIVAINVIYHGIRWYFTQDSDV